jgi:hypothetical protein
MTDAAPYDGPDQGIDTVRHPVYAPPEPAPQEGPYDPPAAPQRKTFGGGKDHRKTVEFDVQAYDETADEDITLTFSAYVDPGSGPVLAFMRARTAQENSSAAVALIYRALVDNDGLSVDYQPPTDDEVADALEEADTDATEDDVREELTDPRFHDKTKWSSRRRFADMVDDEHLRVDADLIGDLAKWLTEQATGRPTGAQSRSRSGRKSTGSGSRASTRR